MEKNTVHVLSPDAPSYNMEWPWEPRPQKKLSEDDAGQIKTLLLHVEKGEMEVESIAVGFGVSTRTIINIRNGKTFQDVHPTKIV